VRGREHRGTRRDREDVGAGARDARVRGEEGERVPRREEDEGLDADPEHDLLPRGSSGEERPDLERRRLTRARERELAGPRLHAEEIEREEQRGAEQERRDRAFEEDAPDPRHEARVRASEPGTEEAPERRERDGDDDRESRGARRRAERKEDEHLPHVAHAPARSGLVGEEQRQHRDVAERDPARGRVGLPRGDAHALAPPRPRAVPQCR
jgi:hypothetical protein